jgi:predicted XRE-type DNA-binding protein
MNTAQKARLRRGGWKVGTAEEFLELTPEQIQLVEMKLALGEYLRRHRTTRHLTQQELAERLGSSQSRVAKLEAGVRGVTLDLLFRALFATGAKTDDIARVILHRNRPAA